MARKVDFCLYLHSHLETSSQSKGMLGGREAGPARPGSDMTSRKGERREERAASKEREGKGALARRARQTPKVKRQMI